MNSYHRIGVVALGLLTVGTSGCHRSGLEKVVLHGNVTYDGTPIPNGQIRFFPIEGTRGPVSGGVIKDGFYTAEGKGGVPVGQHRVEIYAYRPVKSKSGGLQKEGGESEQYIPAKYSGGSSLTASVTADSGSKSIDFTLER